MRVGACALVQVPAQMLPPPHPTHNTHTHTQVGASQKLASVIDGEGLMNDGSALVIFLLLQKIVEGEVPTVSGVSLTACAATGLSVDQLWKGEGLTVDPLCKGGVCPPPAG